MIQNVLLIILTLLLLIVLLLLQLKKNKLRLIADLLDLDVEAAQKTLQQAREDEDIDARHEAIGALEATIRIRGGIRAIM